MRSLIATFIFLAAAANSHAASGAASISWEARLAKDASSCLKLRAPQFRIWTAADFYQGVLDNYSFTTRRTPSIVTGDFDGDGFDDVAVGGRDGDKAKLIAIFVDDKKCVVEAIISRPYEDPSTIKVDMGKESGHGLIEFLSSAQKGKKTSPFEKKALNLKTDAIIVSVFGKASTLYYREKGGFKPYALAD